MAIVKGAGLVMKAIIEVCIANSLIILVKGAGLVMKAIIEVCIVL
jgi:hypothetical protein